METAEHPNVPPAEEHIIPFYVTKREENKKYTTPKNRRKTEMGKKKTRKTLIRTKIKRECINLIRMYQMEYEEAERELGGPEEGEFEDHSESLWTIFEEETDNDDYPMEEQEEPNEYFWSMMNVEGKEKLFPTDTIKELAMMDMKMTKETSQK